LKEKGEKRKSKEHPSKKKRKVSTVDLKELQEKKGHPYESLTVEGDGVGSA